MKQTGRFISLFHELTSPKNSISEDIIEINLKDYISLMLRDLPADGISNFISEITIRLTELIDKPGTTEKQLNTIIKVMDLLRMSDIEETFIKFNSKTVVDCLMRLDDKDIIDNAAVLLGNVIKIGSNDLIENELEIAEKYISRGKPYNGIVILKEIISYNESICFIFKNKIIHLLLKGLYDKSRVIRHKSEDCLNLLFQLFNSKDVIEFVPNELYEQAINYLKTVHPTEIQHGALLLLITLLKNYKLFMAANFREVFTVFLSYKDNKNVLIKQTVILSLPYFIQFNPTLFINTPNITSTNVIVTNFHSHESSDDLSLNEYGFEPIKPMTSSSKSPGFLQMSPNLTYSMDDLGIPSKRRSNTTKSIKILPNEVVVSQSSSSSYNQHTLGFFNTYHAITTSAPQKPKVTRKSFIDVKSSDADESKTCKTTENLMIF